MKYSSQQQIPVRRTGRGSNLCIKSWFSCNPFKVENQMGLLRLSCFSELLLPFVVSFFLYCLFPFIPQLLLSSCLFLRGFQSSSNFIFHYSILSIFLISFGYLFMSVSLHPLEYFCCRVPKIYGHAETQLAVCGFRTYTAKLFCLIFIYIYI